MTAMHEHVFTVILAWEHGSWENGGRFHEERASEATDMRASVLGCTGCDAKRQADYSEVEPAQRTPPERIVPAPPRNGPYADK